VVRRGVQPAATLGQRIVDHLATVESAGAHQLAKAVKATRESVAATLSYLNSKGRIRRVSRGRYARRR
jgi:predicted transcriptional regulator of viral defense system